MGAKVQASSLSHSSGPSGERPVLVSGECSGQSGGEPERRRGVRGQA